MIKIYSGRQLSEMLGVNRGTVCYWVKHKKGFPEPRFVLVNTDHCYWEEEQLPEIFAWFEHWMATNDTRTGPKLRGVVS